MRKGKLLVGAIIAMVCLAVCGGVLVYAATTPKDATYIGSKKCRSCHTKEYKYP